MNGAELLWKSVSQRSMTKMKKLMGMAAFSALSCSATYVTFGQKAAAGVFAGISTSVLLLMAGLLPRKAASRLSWFIHSQILRSPQATTPKDVENAEWNFSEVHPNLFLGRQPRHSQDLQELKDKGVGAIVCLNEEWELFVEPSSPLFRTEEEVFFERLDVPTPDYTASRINETVAAVSFIREQIGKTAVYVHCNAGKGRSTVVVAAYLLSLHPDKTPVEVLDEIKVNRPIIAKGLWQYPWRGQARAVWNYADLLRDKLS